MTAVEIARKAFHKLAELGLPPTPENYDAQYRSISGEPAKAASAASDDDSPRRLGMLRTLLQVMTSANADLHADLTRFTVESNVLLEQAAGEPQADAIDELFRAMTASSSWLLGEVDQMRKELERTREQLDAMTSELHEAQHLATSDPLTGLPNRRGIDATLTRELSRSHRQKTPLCVAMLDLDHFKQLNDRYGHIAGDMALVHFASTLRANLRDVDLIARFGGEEFLVVMPDTAIIGAEFGINRLLRQLETMPLVVSEGAIVLRFSGGVAQWQHEETVTQLLQRADAALYAAKRAGRGRIAVAPCSDEEMAVTRRHQA